MRSVFQLAMLVPATIVTLLWIVLALKYEDKFEESTAASAAHTPNFIHGSRIQS